jgi:hypothetical protein
MTVNSSRHIYFSPPDSSVVDPDPIPDPNPSDPYFLGPPGFGSGPFYHQAKIVRKTLIPTAL